jgi:galactose-1-phosphate uridylyltransferase
MEINRGTIEDVAAAADLLVGMYICSNTDLSGTGASILAQRHYQLVSKRFPIMDAGAALNCKIASGASKATLTIEYLNFGCAAVRVRGSDVEEVVGAVDRLLDSWRSASMATVLNTSVSTLTASFVCYKGADGTFEMIIIPRTSTRMTRESLHCIKSEFVGILEMAGYAILPKRLKTELAALLLEGAPPIGELASFAPWMKEFGVATDVSAAVGAGANIDRLVASPEVNAALNAAFHAIIEDNSGFPSMDLVTAAAWLYGAGITRC